MWCVYVCVCVTRHACVRVCWSRTEGPRLKQEQAERHGARHGGGQYPSGGGQHPHGERERERDRELWRGHTVDLDTRDHRRRDEGRDDPRGGDSRRDYKSEGQGWGHRPKDDGRDSRPKDEGRDNPRDRADDRRDHGGAAHGRAGAGGGSAAPPASSSSGAEPRFGLWRPDGLLPLLRFECTRMSSNRVHSNAPEWSTALVHHFDAPLALDAFCTDELECTPSNAHQCTLKWSPLFTANASTPCLRGEALRGDALREWR